MVSFVEAQHLRWQVIIAALAVFISMAGGFAIVIQHDQSKTDALQNLSLQMVDITAHLRDIQSKLDAGAVYPVQIAEMARRAEVTERNQDAVNTRLQSIDAELVYLRNQSDNSKAAFADIWPRLSALERKRRE